MPMPMAEDMSSRATLTSVGSPAAELGGTAATDTSRAAATMFDLFIMTPSLQPASGLEEVWWHRIDPDQAAADPCTLSCGAIATGPGHARAATGLSPRGRAHRGRLRRTAPDDGDLDDDDGGRRGRRTRGCVSLRDAVAQANAILNADIPLRRAAEGQTLTLTHDEPAADHRTSPSTATWTTTAAG